MQQMLDGMMHIQRLSIRKYTLVVLVRLAQKEPNPMKVNLLINNLLLKSKKLGSRMITLENGEQSKTCQSLNCQWIKFLE